MSHTPGPWFRESDINDEGSDWILVTKGYELIADLRLDSGLNPVSEEEQDANAFLIAAAPELLAVLRTALNELVCLYEEVYPDDESDNDTTAAIDAITDVIAKAEGRK